METPCKTCDRKGCGAFHDQCETYQAWKGQIDEGNRKKQLRNDAFALSSDHKKKYWQQLKGGRKP